MAICKNCYKVIPSGASFCTITCKIAYMKRKHKQKKNNKNLQKQRQQANIRGEKW